MNFQVKKFPTPVKILPAPNIVKVVPNVIMCGNTQEVTVYGQLFKKGKGVTCGIINLGSHPSFSPNSLNETFPPWKVKEEREREVLICVESTTTSGEGDFRVFDIYVPIVQSL